MTQPGLTERPADGTRLRVNELTVQYAGRHGAVDALRDVSVSVRAGEILGIVGESGSGKTTLLRAVLRLLKPPGRIMSGQILFEGRDLARLGDQELRKLRGDRITAIFQSPANSFNPAETIGTQLERIFRVQRPDQSAGMLRDGIIESLNKVGVDGRSKLGNYPFEFSQGQLQRIMVAAACLAGNPSVVLADEPTTSLDVTIEAQVIRLLRQLQDELGISLLLVTHNLALVAELCDRVAVLYAGRVVEDADVQQLYRSPSHPYTMALLRSIPSMDRAMGRLRAIKGNPPDLRTLPVGCSFAPRCDLHLGEICNTTMPDFWPVPAHGQSARCHAYDPAAPRSLMVAATTSLDGHEPERPPVGGTPILSIRGLQKHFVSEPFPGAALFGRQRIVRAVDGVTLEIRTGETLGLIGESGCGKTTLGHSIMGIVRPTAGQVVIDGAVSYPPANGRPRLAGDVQMVFQDPHSAVNRRKTVEDIVGEPLLVNGRGAERPRRVPELLGLVGLPGSLHHRYPHELSGGELQRVVIARALALGPRILIGDEPTSSLDLSARAQIIDLFDDLRRDLGLTLLLISHDLATVAYLADRIAVMYLGRIVETAPTRQLLAAPQHPYTRTLLASIPRPDPERRRRRDEILPLGEVPSAVDRPSGCHYHPRCPLAMTICRTDYPRLLPSGSGDVACHAVERDGPLLTVAKRTSEVSLPQV